MSKDFLLEYYQTKKERLQKWLGKGINIFLKKKKKKQEYACKRYSNYPVDKRENKRQHGRERFRNLSVDEKQSFVEIEEKILKNGKINKYHKVWKK